VGVFFALRTEPGFVTQEKLGNTGESTGFWEQAIRLSCSALNSLRDIRQLMPPPGLLSLLCYLWDLMCTEICSSLGWTGSQCCSMEYKRQSREQHVPLDSSACHRQWQGFFVHRSWTSVFIQLGREQTLVSKGRDHEYFLCPLEASHLILHIFFPPSYP
jgi:hypothetical protein